MTQRERIEAMCCGDAESADLVELLLRRERMPLGTDGESVSRAALSTEQDCARCGWPLDPDAYCVMCGATHAISNRGDRVTGGPSLARRTEEVAMTTTLTPELEAWLDHLTLIEGAAPHPNGEACVMQAVAYINNEPWSDRPECASPIITSFLIRWNDALPDSDRHILKPLIPKIAGTRTRKKDEEIRAWMLTDWLARECAPAFLRCAGLTAQAELLEALSPLTSASSAQEAQPTLDKARKESAAAGDAARDAAWAAAGAAAWDAARDAAGAAAWDAARAAARDAAWDAAWAAAGAAARDALQPTVAQLQKSALLLVERMIEVSAR